MSSVEVVGDTARVADGTVWKMDERGQVDVFLGDRVFVIQKADIEEIVDFLHEAAKRARKYR